MGQQVDISSLNLIKAEVDATLVQVQSQLESYLEESSEEALGTVIAGLTQAWGALHVAGLRWADDILLLARDLVRDLPGREDESARHADLSAIGYALMVLSRYLEYAQIKHALWPQLLLPALQQLRQRCALPALADGELLPELALIDVPVQTRPAIEAAARARALAQVGQVYRTGLLAWLGGAEDAGHLHWMRRALQRLQLLLMTPQEQALRAVLEASVAAVQQGISISPPRKQFLMRIERMLSQLRQGQPLSLPPAGLRMALYLVALADPLDPLLAQLQADYGLNRYALSERRLTEEFDLMCGPGHSVIRTVSSVLAEELAQLKDHLDMMSRGVLEASSGTSVQEQLRRLAQTLKMLSLHEISQRMQGWADRFAQGPGPLESEELAALVDLILEVEDAMSRLLRDVTPGMDWGQADARVSPHQLDEARATLVAESRSGLSLAKRAITSFMEANYDRLHLANVPSTLSSVAGGMAFLGVLRAEAVLQQASAYIDHRLLRAEVVPQMTDMELLADAISSVDYYLESLEAHKPIGDAVLLLAENSMAQLGFPVSGRIAA